MKTNMPFEDSGHEPLPPANLIARHPKGTGARVLLTSVFGPYARDDDFGSRRINPMELYHNQGRACRGACRYRVHGRCRSLRARRWHLLDAPLSGPGGKRSRPGAVKTGDAGGSAGR